MPASETRITKITRAIGGVTSIFRCHGLQYVPPGADRLGGHDLFYWSGFLAVLSGWFLFIYMPQCRRLENLTGRQQALLLQFDADKKELARLQRGIVSLNKGDALAWERAARERFGWLEPGEVLDVEQWRKSRAAFSANWNGIQTPGASRNQAPQQPILPRPRLPQIPQPTSVPPTLTTNANAIRFTRFADAGSLGPTVARPPAPPPPAPALPALPPRQAQPVPVSRRAATVQAAGYRTIVR